MPTDAGRDGGGDTTTTDPPGLSSVALLQSLEVREGATPLALTPAFTQTNFGLYTVGSSLAATQVEIVAVASDDGATVSGDVGVQPITPGANGFTVTVTAEDGVATETYTLNVNRPSNATLAGLTVDGVSVSAFDPAVFLYTVSKPAGTSSVAIGATPSTGATVISGTGAQAVGAGQSQFAIRVQSGPDTVDYLVRVEVPPAQVTGFSAGDGTNPSGVDLSWSAVAGADSYRIERQTAGAGPFTAITTVTAPTTTYLDDSATGGDGRQHTYRVAAIADGIVGAYSASDPGRAGVGDSEVTITFDDPNNPTITLGGGIATGDTITVGTTVNFSAATGYDSYSWLLNGVAAELAEGILDTDGNTNTFDSSITGVGTYTVSLVVSDNAGNLFSAHVTVTVVQP